MPTPSTCSICGSPLHPFHNFGRMPIANGFLAADRFKNEFFSDLSVSVCPKCFMVQLTTKLDPGQMFHDDYAYYSSTSKGMVAHFKGFADHVKKRYLGADPFVVEIGSNDGILIQNFSAANIRHLGIEPSANVAKAASKKGINTLSSFFDEDVAAQVKARDGAADAVLGANVICHIEKLPSLIKGVRLLLKDKGVFIFEEPYLADILTKVSYDQIYDEHIYYFCVSSLSHLFATFGMEIIDVEHQDVHGGSMRYTVAKTGALPVSAAVIAQKEYEQKVGVSNLKTYDAFSARVDQSRNDLKNFVANLKKDGKRIVGYGATSKSTTVLNFCGLGPEHIEFISDTTPGKQGKFSPGVHIPIKPYDDFKKNPPEYALLFAWNHAAEILANEKGFMASGGKFFTYVPDVHVLN